MTKHAELLAPQDRQQLSQKYILEWIQSNNQRKLDALRNELKGREKEAVRKNIKDNTKKELKKYRSELTDPELETHSTTFVKDLDQAYQQKKLKTLIEKYDIIVTEKDKSDLLDRWINRNDPNKKTELLKDDYKYFILSDMPGNDGKELFLMVSIAENLWGEATAKGMYTEYKSGHGDPDYMDKFRDIHFNEKKGLGFYYAPKEFKNAKKKTMPKGWYMPGIPVDIQLGADLVTAIQNPDFKEKHKDKQWLATLNTNFKEVQDKNKTKKELYDWLMLPKHKNQWVPLSKALVNKVGYLYSQANMGQYFYRYSEIHQQVFLVKNQNSTDVKDDKFWGFINCSNQTLGDTPMFFSKTDPTINNKLKTIIGKMPVSEIGKEMIFTKLKQDGAEKLSLDEKLFLSRGLIEPLKEKPESVPYDELQSKYLDDISGKLKTDIEKNLAVSPRDAEILTDVRIEYLRKQIDQKVESDIAMRNALKENPKEDIIITISKTDVVDVKMKNAETHKKFLDKLKEKKDLKKVTEADFENQARDQIMKKIEDKLGPTAAPVIMLFLEKFFKLKDGLKKLSTGKSSMTTTMLLSVLGIKFSKDMIGTMKLNAKALETLFPLDQHRFDFKGKRIFDEDTVLSGMQIVIPAKKGIKAGGKIVLFLDDTYTIPYDPNTSAADHEKAKFKISDITDKFKKGTKGSKKHAFYEYKIVLKDKTKIPKNTVIPKGSYIERIYS